MNTPTITMDPAEAKARLKSYRSQLHRRVDKEYEAVAQGYEALSEGTPLLSLADVFRSCPFDGMGRPKLAIARADRRQVYFTWVGWNGNVGRFDTNVARGRSTPTLRIDVNFGDNAPVRKGSGHALVPMIPASVRDVSPASYDRDRFILWEVEEWADRRIGASPPVDPYLLRHLAGDLYIILAEWDLTPLERAIVAGRRDP